MTTKYARPKRITSGTKEWADYNVNCLIGCLNNCRYCYAKLMAKRFGRATDDDWKVMRVRESVLQQSFGKKKGRIMFPSTHDIVDVSPFKEACFAVLEKLLLQGNEVLITTKPRLSIVKEITHRFYEYSDNIQFRFTITSVDNQLLRFWEPNAPLFNERFQSLQFAFNKHFRTSVSIEPFLDHDPTDLINLVTPFTTESIWLGRMNYIARSSLTEDDEIYYNQVRKNYETVHLRLIYDRVKGLDKIRFKDSIKNQLLSSNT